MRLTCSLRALSGKMHEAFVKYSNYSPTPVSLKKLASFGEAANQALSFKFLRYELPVRLANIMQEINLLPDNLLKTPSVKLVQGWYEQSFQELLQFEKETVDTAVMTSFTDQLATIRDRHSHVVETMAQGVMEMQDRYGSDVCTDISLQYFLDRFYMNRISIRMLINQHVLLFGPELNYNRRYIGSIDTKCNVVQVIEDAYANAKYLCELYYNGAPDMKLDVINPDESGYIEITYVPSHLYHIAFELIKNALRAVVENKPDSVDFPPIQIRIVRGNEDVTFTISDQGGGIARSAMDLVFRYTYTTAKQTGQGPDPGSQAPLAGYGYGLPLSRLYAKYFNGDLTLSSADGYGTEAFVYLKRWAADADELLPVFNLTSAREYARTGIPVNDWSTPQLPHSSH